MARNLVVLRSARYTPSRGGAHATTRRQAAGWIIYWALLGVTVLALAGSVAAVLTTGRAFTEPSTSMANTIRPGDVVVVARTTQVHRGDVIVEQQTVPSPGNYVRRIIGLPGDHVACCAAHGRITVNGKPLDESYLYPGKYPLRSPLQGHCAKGAPVASRGSRASLI